ncbi:MAG: carbohydrate ABC transporter substrate-binding protein [Lachnospiraceae bacterium]|nr:carbohydrate ABC transporter substrate-binding protein [Lachnospiraceae bacterium]
MEKKRKTYCFSLFCALVLALSVALGGCGAGEETVDATDPLAEETTQLRIFYYSTVEQSKFEEYVARYCEKYSELEFVLETSEPGEDQDIVLNRLMADISQGKGPDILILSRKTLEIFQDNGALAELSGVLPEELTGQIFDSVLRQGRIGDGLYGVAWEAGVETLLVPEKVWEGDTWRVADVLSLLEERETQGVPYDRWISISYSLTAEQMLYDLTLQGIEGIEGRVSTLVDMEQGKCFFDTSEFVRLLEVCKKYGEVSGSREYTNQEECYAEVESGRALALLCSGDLKEFSRAMAICEDGYHCVGYPTEDACGSHVNCSRFMAVNVGTENYDIAVGFLKEMLSEEVQRKDFGISSVRRDVLTENIVEHPSFCETPVFMLGENAYAQLEGKADGSSWVREYVELLDKGVPGSWELSEIQVIVMEEAAPYFNGDKSAEEAAEVIQSKVSLYLAERQDR